jgi:hypothetical protein
LTSIVITGDSFALNTASKKLNDRANELDQESEKAKKDVAKKLHFRKLIKTS